MARLLLCPPLFPPSRGGSQALFAGLARHWRADGGEAVVYTCAADRDGHDASPDPVPVRRFAARRLGTSLWRGRLLAAAARLGPAPWRAAVGFPHVITRGYRRHLRHHALRLDGPFDLLLAGVLPHTHFMEPAARFARRHRIPWVAVPLLHTGLLDGRPLRQVAGPAAAALLSTAARVIALTPAEVPVLTAMGVPAGAIAVLPAALERREPPGRAAGGGAPCAPPYVLQAGALAADKGTLDLIAAHRLRVEGGAGERLVLAGHAASEVRRALARLPTAVRSMVELVEEPGDEVWHDTLAGAALVVQPSRADAFGLVVLEAWRAGRPVLVAAAGGLPHLVRDGEDGRVCRAGDPAALARAMDAVLADPAGGARLAARGRERFRENLTWATVYPRWRRVLVGAMAAPGSGRAA